MVRNGTDRKESEKKFSDEFCFEANVEQMWLKFGENFSFNRCSVV